MGAVTCLRGDKDSYRTAVGLHSNTPQGITSARWFATTDWIRFLESRFKDCLRLSLSTEPSSAAVTIHPNPPLAGVIPRPNPISCSLNLFIEQLSTNLSNRSIILRIVCRRFLYFKVWPPSVLESRPIDGRDEDQRPSAPTKLPRVSMRIVVPSRKPRRTRRLPTASSLVSSLKCFPRRNVSVSGGTFATYIFPQMPLGAQKDLQRNYPSHQKTCSSKRTLEAAVHGYDKELSDKRAKDEGHENIPYSREYNGKGAVGSSRAKARGLSQKHPVNIQNGISTCERLYFAFDATNSIYLVG